MTKEEFAEELRKRGYQVIHEEGCVIVLRKGKGCFRELEKIAKAVGYDGSYGWRMPRKEHNEDS